MNNVSKFNYTSKNGYNSKFCFLQGYLHALGMARTAQVKRDARIGEAEAKRDSGIKVTSMFN